MGTQSGAYGLPIMATSKNIPEAASRLEIATLRSALRVRASKLSSVLVGGSQENPEDLARVPSYGNPFYFSDWGDHENIALRT
jgi:hypothetical protein